MRKINLFLFFALILSLVIAGCSFFGGKPAEQFSNNIIQVNQNKTSQQDNTTVIIIKNQTKQNQTSDQNENVTITKSRIYTDQYKNLTDERFAIYFINVGRDELQGDAILIKKGDFNMLVDTGNELSTGKVTDFLKSKGVDDIEVLVSTHANKDEYGGMNNILDAYGIEELWWQGKFYGDKNYESLIKRANDANIKIKDVKAGDQFNYNGLNIQILNPSVSKSFGDTDNDAITMKITQKNFCIILTSDILGGAQNYLANVPNIDLHCDVMQMPGHGLGRATSQIDIFMLKVNPKDVIFSGSVNDPSQDPKGTRFTIYERLRLKNISYYENYKNGTIKITSDGSQYAIEFLSD